jgi:hypothetical protein
MVVGTVVMGVPITWAATGAAATARMMHIIKALHKIAPDLKLFFSIVLSFPRELKGKKKAPEAQTSGALYSTY